MKSLFICFGELFKIIGTLVYRWKEIWVLLFNYGFKAG